MRADSKRLFTNILVLILSKENIIFSLIVLTQKITQPGQNFGMPILSKMRSYGSIVLAKKCFQKMCCLKNGSNSTIQIGGHKNSAEIKNISVTSHDMKTNIKCLYT